MDWSSEGGSSPRWGVYETHRRVELYTPPYPPVPLLENAEQRRRGTHHSDRVPKSF